MKITEDNYLDKITQRNSKSIVTLIKEIVYMKKQLEELEEKILAKVKGNDDK